MSAPTAYAAYAMRLVCIAILATIVGSVAGRSFGAQTLAPGRAAPAAQGTPAGTPSAAPPAIDPAAMQALTRMGSYLRTLQSFQIQSTTSLDDVLESGQKITFDGTVDMVVQRPNRLRVEIDSDRQHRMFFYDGKTFSMWARRLNFYATVPAPASIKELVDNLSDKYGIDVPMTDIFYWGSEGASTPSITGAAYIGPSPVNGVTCEHYAFRQEGLDWQVWIQAGDYPLPRKLILTTTDDAARPEYTTVMNWNLAPSFNDAAFSFTPPPDGKKIVFAEILPPAAAPGR